MRARAADVALAAGVSQSAVSRTFRDGSVSPQVRARVLNAASRLGYRPNAMARAVITRRSGVVGLLMSTATNAHYPEALPQISKAFAAKGLRIMLFTVDHHDQVTATIDQALSYQLDGLVSLTNVPVRDAATLDEQGLPLVLYNQAGIDHAANLISCDHCASGRALARYLLDLGHLRFGIITASPHSSLSAGRAEGVTAELAAAGILCAASVCGDFGYDSGRAAAAVLLAGQAVTAIIAVNDMMALGAIDAARAAGFAVPGDVSVAGFDGTGAACWDAYCLTTMVQPLESLANAAVEMIVERRDTPDLPKETRLLNCVLEVGRSTGVPR